MTNYKSMYFSLAAQVANAIEILIDAQQEGENAFLEDSPALLALANKEETKKEQPGSI